MRTINQEQKNKLKEAIIRRMVEVNSMHKGLADLMLDRKGELDEFKKSVKLMIDNMLNNILDSIEDTFKIPKIGVDYYTEEEKEKFEEDIINDIAYYIKDRLPTATDVADIVLKSIRVPQDGKTPTKKELKSLIKELLPKQTKANEDIILAKFQLLLDPKLSELKNNILSDIKNGKEFKATDIYGLEQTVRAWINQTGGSKGYLHGGGITELTAGTGIALTRLANGNYTITATGTASLGILTTASTINDTNKDFVFASKPSIIFMNGTAYRDGSTVNGVTAWTWNAGTLTATMFAPVGTGGDIYGI